MKNIKASIVTSAVTTILLNYLGGWIIFLGVWIILGFRAKKLIDSYSKPDPFKYGLCFILPPLAILCVYLFDGAKLNDIFGSYFLKLPKFRNPFVWPEKPEPHEE